MQRSTVHNIELRAMILAAGRGERMRPLTDYTPKPLLQVAGKPLIVWHIEALVRAGFKHLVINTAHLGHLIHKALGDGAAYGAHIAYSDEPIALETAGGIANAMHVINPQHTRWPFLVVNGDVWTNYPFVRLHNMACDWIAHSTQAAFKPLAHLVLVSNPSHHPSGDFYLHQERVQYEKPDDSCHALTFSGIGLYRPELFSDVVAGQAAKLAPILKEAMKQQQVTGEHFDSGSWMDIGTPERLALVNHTLQPESAKP